MGIMVILNSLNEEAFKRFVENVYRDLNVYADIYNKALVDGKNEDDAHVEAMTVLKDRWARHQR